MKQCRINKLNIQSKIDNLLKDFSIVKFSTSEKYIKYGSLILDEINLKLKTKSIVHETGKSFYALFDKAVIETTDLVKELEKIENGDTLTFQILNKVELEKIPQHTLTQLLFNSIATPNHKSLTFNNLTGKLYLFDTNHFKISNSREKEQVFKIVGIELYVAPNCSLQLNVKTFSSILLNKKMDFSNKKIQEYPKYTFVHSTNTLKRVLPSEKISSDNIFILKQTLKNGRLEKNFVSFLNFKSLNEFEKTKIGILNKALKTINSKLSDYIEINFVNISIEQTIRYKNAINISNAQETLHLVDKINDEDSIEVINTLKDELTKSFPKSTIKLSKKENKNGLNINLIHNKSHYQKYNLKDLYKPTNNNQHITIEDFKSSKASLNTVVKELMIKSDIKNNQISIVDWNAYNYENNWVFGLKRNDEFYFITINPEGKLHYEKFESNLFNQNEYDELCNIFDEDINVEFIVKDDIGNINIIKRTNNFPIPEFETIYEVLANESKKIILTKNEAIGYIKEVFSALEKQDDLINKIQSLEVWSKKTLLSSFENRNDRKEFALKIQSETGEILNSYLRNATRYEILDSQLDIHRFQYENKNFYYVGVKGQGIKYEMSRASIIREISTHKNSSFIFDKLLPLMNVDFVKNGDLTVVPFPVKFLNEYIKSKSVL